MRNIMVEIEYDGTNYCGWQMQPNGNTIQAEIMGALEKLTGKPTIIHGSGRTDGKVHARGQVASFQLHSSIPTDRIADAMNSKLPRDISILRAQEVPAGFHARYSAIGKRYAYHIILQKQRSALMRNYSYHMPYEIDIEVMRRASRHFIGTHDFRGFMSSGSAVQDTVRRIDDIQFVEENNSLWITFEGNGFLYNMVRIMVGTLVDIGIGKKTEQQIQEALLTGERKLAGHTAPPQGLYLDKVFYPLTR